MNEMIYPNKCYPAIISNRCGTVEIFDCNGNSIKRRYLTTSKDILEFLNEFYTSVDLKEVTMNDFEPNNESLGCNFFVKRISKDYYEVRVGSSLPTGTSEIIMCTSYNLAVEKVRRIIEVITCGEK